MEQMEGADAERKGKKKEVKWKGKRKKTQGNGGILCSSDNWSGERRGAAGVDADEI